MPRKDRTIAGTRAERWLREDHARRRPIAPGVVEVGPAPETLALASLLRRGPTDLDAPIRQAIAGGFLRGDVYDHRRDLVYVASMARGAVAASHAHAIAASAAQRRRSRAACLAEELRDLCRDLTDVVLATEETAEDWEVEDLEAERSVIAAGGDAAAALEALAAQRWEPAPRLTEASALEAEVKAWWQENAVDPDRRGAAAARDEITEALLRILKQGAIRD